jgi:hypothetical protein
MATATDITGYVFVGGSAVTLARIEKADGTALVQADVSSITYTVYQLPVGESPAAVEGHTDAPLVIEDVIFDTLQTDGYWTADATGYNFRHEVDVTEHDAFTAFTTAQANHRIEYKITPVLGQVIIVRYQVEAR